MDDFNPMPDLLVVHADADFDCYADVFLCAAEIISASNFAERIKRKLELYRRHPDNLYCLTVDQHETHVAVWARHERWKQNDLRSISDVLRLPVFGLEARLADIYAGTPLAR